MAAGGHAVVEHSNGRFGQRQSNVARVGLRVWRRDTVGDGTGTGGPSVDREVVFFGRRSRIVNHGIRSGSPWTPVENLRSWQGPSNAYFEGPFALSVAAGCGLCRVIVVQSSVAAALDHHSGERTSRTATPAPTSCPDCGGSGAVAAVAPAVRSASGASCARPQDCGSAHDCFPATSRSRSRS